MIQLWDTSEINVYKLKSIPDGATLLSMESKSSYIEMLFRLPDGSIKTICCDPIGERDFYVV